MRPTDRPQKPTEHKPGDVREDGLVFLRYYWPARGSQLKPYWHEQWLAPKTIAKLKEREYGKSTKAKSVKKATGIHRKYGLSSEDHTRLLEYQEGRCAVCGDPFVEASRVCVDHDHQIGTVRGLLCVLCNTSLGGFRDNAQTLYRAVEYLREPPTRVLGIHAIHRSLRNQYIP